MGTPGAWGNAKPPRGLRGLGDNCQPCSVEVDSILSSLMGVHACIHPIMCSWAGIFRDSQKNGMLDRHMDRAILALAKSGLLRASCQIQQQAKNPGIPA